MDAKALHKQAREGNVSESHLREEVCQFDA
jgi:hypothetical protein